MREESYDIKNEEYFVGQRMAKLIWACVVRILSKGPFRALRILKNILFL